MKTKKCRYLEVLQVQYGKIEICNHPDHDGAEIGSLTIPSNCYDHCVLYKEFDDS
jgi:hypothetical protein